MRKIIVLSLLLALLIPVTSFAMDAALFEAVGRGDITGVKEYIKKGGKIDDKDDQGRTLLHAAAWGGGVKDVRDLIRLGAKVDSRMIKGYTPLFYAVKKDHAGVIKLLLAAGADPNTKAEALRSSPLQVAALNGKLQTVKILLKAGANIEQKDAEGATALFYAAFNNNIDMMKLLMEAGAKINAKDKNNHTPLFTAAIRGNTEAIRLLAKAGADLEVERAVGVHGLGTALFWAVSMDKVDAVKALVEAGAEVNVYVKRSDATALAVAGSRGNMEIVVALLESGVEVTEGAITAARDEGYLDIAHLLNEVYYNGYKRD